MVEKRIFDVVFASVGLLLTGWLILLAWLTSGFFTQVRVGRNGRQFRIVKIRTMRPIPGYATVVTTSTDPRITRLGRFLRRTKIDELPQLFNVLVGHMSFVGPRPEVPEYVALLDDDDRRVILSVRPGITGPATLKYHDEETLLAQSPDPEQLNRDVIYPDKTRLNREYVEQYSFARDLGYIARTLTLAVRR